MKGIVTSSNRVLLAVMALFVTACVASAQQQPKPPAESSVPARSETQALNNFATGLTAFSGGGIVKGAPFSAVGIVEITQTLSDGSRIERRREDGIYRDSLGSTRNEMRVNKINGEMTAVPAIIIFPRIFDAVTGASYFFDPHRHTALLFPPNFVLGSGPRQSKIVTPQSPPDDISRIAGEKVERLGTQVIEGLKVEGVRATTTIPASQMRNNQPGKVIYERWYSQELRVNVLIKCTDPRFGEGVFRLTNINRSEPAHELFLVPPDYKVTELKFGPPKGSELNKPLNLKFERGYRLAVENRTTGHIRVIGWDKDFVEAKATSERGAEAVRFSVEGEPSEKRIWLKADYAKREEPQTLGLEPEPETETKPKPDVPHVKPVPAPTPKVPAKPTIRPPGQFRMSESSEKSEISYRSEISYSDGPPLRDGQPIEVDLEVRVPRYAEIEMIKVVKSPLEISDVETPLAIFGDKGDVILKNVGTAEVHTRTGAIEIENASGFIDAVTTSGPIRVRRSGGDVRVFSINGFVEIECASGRVNVDNTNGTINLTNIGGDVDANTSISNIIFMGAIREDGRYHLKSMSGAVEMAVQEKPLGFTAVLSSYSGIIENEFELKVKQASEHEEKLNHRIIGSYGSGRAQVTLDTFDGKINLRKAAPGRLKECKMQN